MRIATAVAFVLTLLARDALACVPLKYDMTGITAESVAQEMAPQAATIEIMRVVSRSGVQADRVYAEYYTNSLYRFRLESVEVLKGFSRGPLELHGFDADWRARWLQRWTPRRQQPLWWTTPEGYAGLQDTVLPDPTDFGSMTCAAPVTFEVGAQYLVFRDESGELLHPGLAREGRPARPAQRPVIERISEDDPWLRQVRASLR